MEFDPTWLGEIIEKWLLTESNPWQLQPAIVPTILVTAQHTSKLQKILEKTIWR